MSSPTIKELAEQHIAAMSTPEATERARRVMNNTASELDLVEFSIEEMTDAMDCLPPMAPDNGRHVDDWHASACSFRAYACLLRLRNKLKARPLPPGQLVKDGQ